MRILRKLLPLVCVAVLPTMAMAQDYQWEVSGSYEADDDADLDVFSAIGTYHWQKVSTQGHPLAEAAFLENVGGLSLNYELSDSGDSDKDAWQVSADYYFDSGLYLAGRYNTPDEGDDTFGASIGFKPVNGLLLALDADDNGDDIDYAGRVKYVAKLAGDSALGLDAVIAEETYTLGGDYYFNSAFSLGADVIINDEADSSVLTFEAKYFFAPNVWASANYGTDVSGDADVSLWGLAAGVRF
ncbi:putative porin [Simiduia curdlanivorans]|uniref:Porin n=1 Tax=Simiduia curdlanivorans TaxID=1492769 RepID=A0ABV8V6X6_9GAMM|nr:putative porin [Simiduia curdlanivorans]MDN3639016.1 putative porin [Simiduia curdlanivorans]